MAVGRGKIVCVSVAYIILGASMAFCGAFQIILHLRYLWLDSIYAGVWVGLWMIVTGIMGIVSSLNQCAEYLSYVFMIFSFISTLLGLEIVSYYTYTGAVHWSVYLSSRNYLIIASVTCFFAIVEIIIGIWAVYFSYVLRRNVQRIAAENASAQAASGTDAGQAAPGNDAGRAKIWFLRRPKWKELPRAVVRQQDSLGKGHFGVVNRGEVQIDGEWTPCAIKRVRNDKRGALREELKIMVRVGAHPNIISLIGACTREEPILLVLRLAENGSLKEYLGRNRQNPISTQDKIKIARDVANGMSHLSSKRCIHRDLAARNVLLDRDNVAMVSDFGLSRDVYESGIYDDTSGGRIPTRWMAIESLTYYTYTTKSDVWSFGVVMWEIESEGMFPYSDLENRNQIIESLIDGRRLKQPRGCSNEIYEIMKTCWRAKPSERPTFDGLSTLLEQQLQNVTRASDSVNDGGQVNNDTMPPQGNQLPMHQRSQDSGASSNRHAPVNDAGLAPVNC